jgi:hypothetical protein
MAGAEEEQVFEDFFRQWLGDYPKLLDGVDEEVTHQIFRAGWNAVLDYLSPVGDSRYLRSHLIQMRQDYLHERGRTDHLISVLTVIATAGVTEPADDAVQ